MTAGADSVSPYPSQMVTPNRSRNTSMTAPGRGAAPDTASRTEDRSAFEPAPAEASHAENMGGAPQATVTP